MKLIIMFMNMLYFASGQLVGSQRDDHGCVMDGGYTWCESTQSCVRSWETPCSSLVVTEPGPVVDPGFGFPSTVCADTTCPPPMPCPMPAMNIDISNCKLNNHIDVCGCQTACPSYDCSSNSCRSDSDCLNNQFCRQIARDIPMSNGRRGLQTSECVDKVGVNSSCGGYVMPGYENRCMDGLECVQTMGPMIADAPGQCREPCNTDESRDDYGNCIVLNTPTIPDNCATWNDGCNTCQVRDGRAEICTLMYCFRQAEPYCMSYHIKSNSLGLNDICYRFCEDGSQSSINRRSDCPTGTSCKKINILGNSIGFDSCGENSMRCLENSSH